MIRISLYLNSSMCDELRQKDKLLGKYIPMK